MTSQISDAQLEIPWGPTDRLSIAWPGDRPAPDVVLPDRSGAIDDYAGALNRALDAMVGAGHARLEDAVGGGGKVAVVVDDPSRWTPVADALRVVLPRVRAAGVRAEDVTICVGVGRHHAVDDSAMRSRVGDDVFKTYTCLSPPVDRLEEYDDLGTTPEGIPVRVFKPVSRARVRILIGSVLPHLQAGFGGGFKLIFPGTSHRSTLGALHGRGLGLHDADPASLLGMPSARNPMRKAIRSAAALLPGECLSVSHVLGRPGEVFQVLAGDVETVQDDLAREVKRRFEAPQAEPADLVIAGNDPWPGDPMQSFKVLLQHRSSGRTGGVMVGFFWSLPEELDRSFPLRAMRGIAATGALGGSIIRAGLSVADGAMQALHAPNAFLVSWARELVVDRSVMVYSPLLRARLGSRLGPIRLYDEPSAIWSDVDHILKSQTYSARLFPQGGLSYAPLRRTTND